MSNRRRRSRAGGEESVPVELRFVDMFMAAIGALIFMAMLLSWIMRDLGAKEAAAKAGTPELQVLAYVTDEAAGEPDTNLLGRFEVDVRIDPVSTNEFNPREPRPRDYYSAANFYPTNFLNSHDTNASGRFTYLGNSLASTSKEVPFAYLTMSYPKPDKFTFVFLVRPILAFETGRPPIDVKKLLSSIEAKSRLKFSAAYLNGGKTSSPIELQSSPVLPVSWLTAPEVLEVQIELTQAGELRIINQ